MGSKKCVKCMIIKDFEEFFKDKKSKDGFQSWCKRCSNLHHKTIEGKQKRRDFDLKKNYGITLEDYDRMLESQDNKCKICDTDSPGSKGRFYVDHNHKTGKLRGLLCHKCNTSLSGFKDDINILLKAIEYLNKTEV